MGNRSHIKVTFAQVLFLCTCEIRDKELLAETLTRGSKIGLRKFPCVVQCYGKSTSEWPDTWSVKSLTSKTVHRPHIRHTAYLLLETTIMYPALLPFLSVFGRLVDAAMWRDAISEKALQIYSISLSLPLLKWAKKRRRNNR